MFLFFIKTFNFLPASVPVNTTAVQLGTNYPDLPLPKGLDI